MSSTKPSLVSSFKRSQIASLIATFADFGTLVTLVEIFKVWYVAATAAGAFCGAVTNFLLGRHWSFQAHDQQIQGQALRYAVVSGVSLVLNSAGVYLFTDTLGLKYFYSKIIVALLVGIFFNFPLHRNYVFK